MLINMKAIIQTKYLVSMHIYNRFSVCVCVCVLCVSVFFC